MNSENKNHNKHSSEPNENTGHLGNHEPYGMSNPGNMNDPAMEGDSYAGQERKESREATSKTFNEDEATYKAEKRAQTTNDGTPGNDWDAKDMTQRTIQEEQRADPGLQHGGYNDENPNKYGQENDRRNREELE